MTATARSVLRESVGRGFGAAVGCDALAIGMEAPRAETRLAEARCEARQPGPKGSPFSVRQGPGLVSSRHGAATVHEEWAVQEAYEAAAKGIGISSLALPNDADAPTAGLEVCDVPCVPRLVLVDLVAPVPRAAGG